MDGEAGSLRPGPSCLGRRSGPLAAWRRRQSPTPGCMDACGGGPAGCRSLAGGAAGRSSAAEHNGAAGVDNLAAWRTAQRHPALSTSGAGANGAASLGASPSHAGHAWSWGRAV
eukprot:14678166-Alexandrium_andersonii.AAC.1